MPIPKDRSALIVPNSNEAAALSRALQRLADMPSLFFKNMVGRRKTSHGERWGYEFPHPYPHACPTADKRVRRIASIDSEKIAEVEARQEWLDIHIAMERSLIPTIPKVSEFVDDWWDRHRRSGRYGRPLAGNTVRVYAQALDRYVLPLLGDHRLDDLPRLLLEEFFADIGEEHAPKYVSNIRGVLTCIVKCAYEWDVIKAPVFVPRVFIPKCAFEFLRFEEKAALLAAAADPMERALFRFAVETGVRPGELIGLHHEDVSLSTRRVTIARSFSGFAKYEVVAGDKTSHRVKGVPGTKCTKTGTTRCIPLTEELKADLRSLEKTDPTRVFPDVTLASLTTRLNAALQRAGLARRPDGSERRLRFYDLRHTFASQLAMSGVSIYLISRWMGHASVKMTERYAHLAPSTDDEHLRGAFGDEKRSLSAAFSRAADFDGIAAATSNRGVDNTLPEQGKSARE